jgi:23S rRNA (pseudouridine1915-N3)-methyltransferase
MRMRIIFLGEDPKDPLQRQAVDYLERAGRRFQAGLSPLSPTRRGKGHDDDAVRLLEAERLLQASDGCHRIALDAGGLVHPSSAAFAADTEHRLARGKPLAFLIGGASGHHPSLLVQADVVWSLGRLTMAHRLAVCVLAEQLYRSAEIARNGPYAR